MAANLGLKTQTSNLSLLLDSNNIASYPRTGTTWTDLSGNGYNGTLTNGTAFSFIDNSMFFDGTNDYVDVANTGTQFQFANTTFTVSLWIKTSSSTGGVIVSKGATASTAGWLFQFDAAGTVSGTTKGSDGTNTYNRTSTATVNNNTWKNIVAVYTTNTTTLGSNTISIYVDGVLSNGTGTLGGLVYATTADTIQIGRRPTGAYWSGSIANIQIYSRALTAAEILNNYNTSKVTFDSTFTSKPNTNNLLFSLDASNTNSYPGSGTTWTDLTGLGRNGTLTNGPTFSSANGGSIVFDGSNDYVDMGTSTYCNITDISFSAWVYLKSGGSNYTIVSRYFNTTQNGFLVYYDSASGRFFADGRESSAAYLSVGTTGRYTVNNWYHVTWTKSANFWSIYVNGVLDTSAGIGNGTTAFTNNNMWLGGGDLGGGGRFYGFVNLAQVNIYNKALSATEVLGNYNSTKSKFGSLNDLVFYFDANNTNSYPGSGTSWYDLSGNSRTGTLTNGPTFSSANGGSVVFDGTNDYVDVTNTATAFSFANTTFTVNIWFKQSSLANGALISKAGTTGGWSVWAISDGTINSFMKNGSSVDNYDRFTSAVITPNTWVNIVAVFTTSTTVAGNNTVTHYVNGVLNTGTVIVGSGAYGSETSTNLFIGRRSTSPYFPGNIAFVQIYNRGLSATEVLKTFNDTKAKFSLVDNLAFYLDAGNVNSYSGVGTAWNDLVPSTKVATLNNTNTFSKLNGGNITFDGSLNFVDISNTAALYGFADSTFTVSIWFRQSALSNGALITKITGTALSGGSAGWAIWTQSDGTILSYFKNGASGYAYSRKSTAVITANAWINITAVMTTSTTVAGNNSITHYVNGAVNTGTTTSTNTYLTDTTTNMNLGPYFTGNISFVQIYDRALTATEISQNYNNVKSRFNL